VRGDRHGAPIADHAFKRPSEVVIQAGWSMAKSQDLSAVNGAYGLLLSWQASLQPFNLYTGKRAYRDMLMTSITVTTDSHSEWALLATIVCKQIILVNTQTVATKADSASETSDEHKEPEKTAPAASSGEATAKPTSTATAAKVIQTTENMEQAGLTEPSAPEIPQNVEGGVVEPPPLNPPTR
jgi:hypothetical protein